MKRISKVMINFTLTFIRHGETGHNRDNVIQGQLDVPLSATGVRQAELLGTHLQHQQYSHVYASDLSRAKQTAEIIMKHNQTYKGSLFLDSRLRERKFGIVEGKNFMFLKEAAGKVNQKLINFTPPGGETVQQVHRRAVLFFQDLCQMMLDQDKSDAPKTCIDRSQTVMDSRLKQSVCSSWDDGDSADGLAANILVVSHGGWIRELFQYFVGHLNCSIPGEKQQALRISPNAGLSKFTVSIEDSNMNPEIICHKIHDKQHLVSDTIGNVISHDIEIAL